jgi:hypothetical protein
VRAAQLAYIAQWIAQLVMPKRFDTRFFVAAAPMNQQAVHDGEKIVAHRWITPAAALAETSNLHLLAATRSVLTDIAKFDSVAALWQYASARTHIPTICPRVAVDGAGRRSILPPDAA